MKILKIIFVCIYFLSWVSPFAFAQETFQIPETAIQLPNGLLLLEDGTEIDPLTGLPPTYDYHVRGDTFFQTLSWQPIENAYRYEVIVEKRLDDGTWILENLYESAEETSSVEVSLFLGYYRYSVIVYNFLNLEQGQTEWFEFEIYKAIQPTLFSFGPDLLYLDEEQTGIFNFEGSGFSERSLFKLTLPELKSGTIIGELIEYDGEKGKIQFPESKLNIGDYTFEVENVGTLKDNFEPIVIKFLKPYDLDVTLGYNVFYTLPGEIPVYFEKDFVPFGASAKVTYIPLKRNFGQIGFELSSYWTLFKNSFEIYDVSTHLIPVTVNFVYQYPIIKKRFIFDTHLGVGTTFLANLQFEFSNGITTPPQNVIGLAVNFGIAFQYYISNRLYTELSTDYIFTLFEGTVLHLMTPSLSVGWQF